MTRYHRYVGENHFPPPEGEGRIHGWYMDGDRAVYGPIPDGVRMVTDHRNGVTMPRVNRATQEPPRPVLIDPWRKRG